MFSIWFYGVIIFVLARTFYAGMNSKSLFYHDPDRYVLSTTRNDPKYSEVGRQISEDKIAVYFVLTLAFSVTWPLSLPALGMFKLGQRFNKEK